MGGTGYECGKVSWTELCSHPNHGGESWTIKKAECQRIDALELWCWRRSWKSLGQQGNQTSHSWGKPTLNTLWEDWCWSWSSSILVIWCKQSTHWKSLWCWERLRAEGKEGVRVWDGWMASLMQWAWTWANFERWFGTGRPGVLQSMGLQRVGCDWATEQQQPVLFVWKASKMIGILCSKREGIWECVYVCVFPAITCQALEERGEILTE